MEGSSLPLVFSRSDAVAAGVSVGRLRGPAYRQIFHDVHSRASDSRDLRVRAVAALLVAPEGALVARQTAAELLGGVVPRSPEIEVALPAGRMRVRGVRARRRVSTSTARIGGVPVTTAEDTFVDLAGELGLVDLVVLGDSLVARRRTTPDALVAAAGRLRGRQAALARRAAALVRAGVDSPMESRLRMLLVLAGLPEPVVNHIEYDEWGAWVRRYDLSYPDLKLAVEYDGRQHAESQRQWERDVERREELDTEGWRIVVVLAKGVYLEPERTLARVALALAAQGRPTRVTSDEWRLHFPST